MRDNEFTVWASLLTVAALMFLCMALSSCYTTQGDGMADYSQGVRCVLEGTCG
jgi:predicted small secreted protein